MALDTDNREALAELAASTTDAVSQALSALIGDRATRGEVTLFGDDQPPFADLPLGGVAASVRYVDGVTGASVLLMPVACARSLAVTIGADAGQGDELSELQLSAVGEAANQMLAAAASAISVVLGQEIQISPPEVAVIDGRPGLVDGWGTAPFAYSITFAVEGELCRLVQLVPSAFVVRMARALDELRVAPAPPDDADDGGGEIPLTGKLHGVNLRVWAELGRARIPIGSALELPAGAVVDLDRAADAPVDLFVNGLCFGQGQLLVTDDGEWAIEVTSLTSPTRRREVRS